MHLKFSRENKHHRGSSYPRGHQDPLINHSKMLLTSAINHATAPARVDSRRRGL